MTLVDFARNGFVVGTERRCHGGHVNLSPVFGHDLFNFRGKVRDLGLQLVCALVWELQVPVSVVSDFVTHLGQVCKARTVSVEVVSTHVRKEERDPHLGHILQNGGEVLDLIFHGIVKGEACGTHMPVPRNRGKRCCSHSTSGKTAKGQSKN